MLLTALSICGSAARLQPLPVGPGRRAGLGEARLGIADQQPEQPREYRAGRLGSTDVFA